MSNNTVNIPTMKTMQTETFNTPLLMFQPMNIIAWLTFYSPYILACFFVFLSVVFNNSKGFIYLAFLLGISIVRWFLFYISGATHKSSTNKVCDTAEYSTYGNSGYSIFAIAFTICYICLPMFLNKDINYWVFGFLLMYLLMDIGIRYMKKCITDVSEILLNLISGAALGVIIPGLLYMGGSSKYLFFNEMSSSKEICSMPKKQQFKCSVYKNGELLSSSTTN